MLFCRRSGRVKIRSIVEPKDLRLGNIILKVGIDYDAEGNKSRDRQDDEAVTVDLDVFKDCIDHPYSYDGVPITSEWLERIRFKEDKAHECYVIWQCENNVSVEYFDGLVHLIGHTSAQPMEHIQYVHQLQNLYFAMTGEEPQIQV